MPDSPSAISLIVDAVSRIETKLDQGVAALQAKLEYKADKSDLAEIRTQVRGHGDRIRTLEQADAVRHAQAEVHQQRDDRSWFSRATRWKIVSGVVGALCALAVATAAIASLVLALSHHL